MLDKIKKYKNWKESWKESSSLGLFHYISFNIHPDDVLILGHLFYPRFIEIDDCIFLSEHYNYNSYLEWRSKLKNDFTAVEKIINHVHVYDIFANCSEDVEDAVFEDVGKLLQLSWSLHLEKEFPNRKITVELQNSEQDYGPTLLVYQKR